MVFGTMPVFLCCLSAASLSRVGSFPGVHSFVVSLIELSVKKCVVERARRKSVFSEDSKADYFEMENLRPYRHTALRKDNIFCNQPVVHTCKQVPDCYIELLTEFRRGKYLFSQASPFRLHEA